MKDMNKSELVHNPDGLHVEPSVDVENAVPMLPGAQARKTLNRRDFMKLAGAAGATLVGSTITASLGGCTPQETTKASTDGGNNSDKATKNIEPTKSPEPTKAPVATNQPEVTPNSKKAKLGEVVNLEMGGGRVLFDDIKPEQVEFIRTKMGPDTVVYLEPNETTGSIIIDDTTGEIGGGLAQAPKEITINGKVYKGKAWVYTASDGTKLRIDNIWKAEKLASIPKQVFFFKNANEEGVLRVGLLLETGDIYRGTENKIKFDEVAKVAPTASELSPEEVANIEKIKTNSEWFMKMSPAELHKIIEDGGWHNAVGSRMQVEYANSEESDKMQLIGPLTSKRLGVVRIVDVNLNFENEKIHNVMLDFVGVYLGRTSILIDGKSHRVLFVGTTIESQRVIIPLVLPPQHNFSVQVCRPDERNLKLRDGSFMKVDNFISEIDEREKTTMVAGIFSFSKADGTIPKRYVGDPLNEPRFLLYSRQAEGNLDLISRWLEIAKLNGNNLRQNVELLAKDFGLLTSSVLTTEKPENASPMLPLLGEVSIVDQD